MRKEVLTVLRLQDRHFERAISVFDRGQQAEVIPGGRRVWSVHTHSPRSDIFLLDSSQPSETTVEELTIRSPVAANVGETIRSAADRMAEKEIGSAPVVEIVSGEPVARGKITEFDILTSRSSFLRSEPGKRSKAGHCGES